MRCMTTVHVEDFDQVTSTTPTDNYMPECIKVKRLDKTAKHIMNVSFIWLPPYCLALNELVLIIFKQKSSLIPPFPVYRFWIRKLLIKWNQKEIFLMLSQVTSWRLKWYVYPFSWIYMNDSKLSNRYKLLYQSQYMFLDFPT